MTSHQRRAEWQAAWPQPARRSMHGRGQTILLVEDEADVRQVIIEQLVALGYRVTAARHGQEALRIYEDRADEIDLVLTDLAMPEMDGPTLIAGLLRLDNPPVMVVLSGQAALEPEPAWSKDIAAWIKKPVDLQELGLTLARALDPHRVAAASFTAID